MDDIKNNFLVTGVGSLPHQDARGAVNLVFETLSDHIPFWPQLPQRAFAENMYVQFSEKLPGLKIDEASRTVTVRTQGQEYADALEECFNKCQADDVDHFAISRDRASGLHVFTQRLMALSWQGWVKAQIIGPFSLGLSLLDQDKNPILYNAELAELLPLFLSLKASWLIRQIKVHARTKVMIFIDEPYLVAVGTAQSTLSKQDIIDKINTVADVIHANGALAGIHCCGNTDWDLVLGTKIDILNFDAYGYLDKVLLYEKALLSFLKRGGIPAIGIVPTDDSLSGDGLAERLFETLKSHPNLLKNGALITTSCGLSGCSVEQSQKALGLCAGLAERLRAGF